MRTYSEENCPRWARLRTVRYVTSLFIYLTFVFSLLLITLALPPILNVKKLIILPFILIGLLYYKDAKYIFVNFPAVRLRYILILILILSAIIYTFFVHTTELALLTINLFILWGILFITSLFWFSKVLTAKFYINIHRKYKNDAEQELNYFKYFSKNITRRPN